MVCSWNVVNDRSMASSKIEEIWPYHTCPERPPLAVSQVAHHFFQSPLHSPFSHAQWHVSIISSQKLVARYAPLWSATDGMLLSVPSTHRCFAAGDNAFSVYGPRLWNDLFFSFRETQSQTSLKINLHLFNLHFGAWTFSTINVI